MQGTSDTNKNRWSKSFYIRSHRRRALTIGIRQLAPMSTPSNTWFLGSTRLHTTNGISIGAAIMQGSVGSLVGPTHTKAYIPRYIGRNRPLLIAETRHRAVHDRNYDMWASKGSKQVSLLNRLAAIQLNRSIKQVEIQLQRRRRWRLTCTEARFTPGVRQKGNENGKRKRTKRKRTRGNWTKLNWPEKVDNKR